jgi:hypothetical protein
MGSSVFLSRSSSTAVALSTSYALMTVGVVGDPVPAKARLGILVVAVDTIAASAATLTVKVTSDAAGDWPITGEMVRTILVGNTTATDGSVVIDFAGAPWECAVTPTGGAGAAVSAGAGGLLYVWAKTNTGTCNGVAVLTGSK